MNSVRNFLCTILLCLCLSPLIHAQALFSRDAEDLQTAAAATGNGTALVVRGWGGAIIQVTGTFSATLTIEGTVDGTNWVTLRVMNVSDGNFVTSVTATGVYAIATAGIETIRARVSAYTSGTVTVKGRGSVAVIARSSGSGGGLTVGTTAITGGTVGRVFFHDTGDVMGEYPVTGTAGNAVLSISPNLTGAPTITSTSNPCFAVGPNGATNPTLAVNCSVASAATGIRVTPAAAGSGVTIGVTSSGTNEHLLLTPKGTGAVVLPNGGFSTPALVFASELNSGFYRIGTQSIGLTLNGSPSYNFTSADLRLTSGVQIGWATPNAHSAIDSGITRYGVAQVRITNGTTGAGQLLVGTSTDTADAQLSVYSQSTTRPGLKLRALSGTGPTQEQFGIYNGSGTLVHQVVNSGQTYLKGTAPTVGGSCGTSPSIAGSNNAGKVTAGTVAPTSCTVTFSDAWTAAPACIAVNETTANLLRATSTTTTVILTGTMAASDVLSYVCVGY